MKNLESAANFLSGWTYSWMDPVFRLGSAMSDDNYMDISEEDKSEKHHHMFTVYKSMFPDRFLFKYIFKTSSVLFYKQLLFGILYAIVSVIPSFMLNQLLNSNTIWAYLGYLCLMVLGIFISSLFVNKTYACGNRLVIRVYSILQSDIMLQTMARKQFQMPLQGELFNYINIDTKIVAEFTRTAYYLITAPIQILVCTAVLCLFLGPSGLLIIGILLVTVPVQKVVMSIIRRLQTRILHFTDERISTTSELLQAIKLVKLNAWEDLFYSKITTIRQLELQSLRNFKWIMAAFDVLFGAIPVLLPLFTLLLYLQFNSVLDPAVVFSMLALLQIVQYPIKDYPETALKYFEFKVSINRLQRYLQADIDTPDVAHLNYIGFKHCKLGYLKPHLNFESYNQTVNSDDFLFLLDLNVIIPPNKLTVILGKTGSGKSLFLQSLCNQLPIFQGEASIGDNELIGYVPQSPWMCHMSIKDNIVLDKEFDPIRYQQILQQCCLLQDINTLPNKDLQLPQSCSGGQIQRIALARALYQNPNIYCFDDFLSSLDAITVKSILNNVILGSLKDKTRLLVTHDTNLLLPNADYIIIMKDGKNIIHGTLQQLQEKITGFDRFVVANSGTSAISMDSSELATAAPVIVQHEKLNGVITSNTYLFYIKCIGGVFLVILILFGDLALQLLSFARDLSLKYWSTTKSSATEFLAYPGTHAAGLNAFYADIYIQIVCVYILLNLLVQCFKVIMDMRGALLIHNKLLSTILGCDLLSLSSTGTILNRFSNDMNVVDKQMANSLFSVTYFIIMISSILVFIMTYAPWFIIPSFVIVVCYYKLSLFYLNCSRELKRLESSNRSPLMTCVLDVINGTTSIQTGGLESHMKQQILTKLDLVNNMLFQMNMSSRWLSIRSDMVGGLIVLTCGLSLIGMEKGLIGLLLTFALQITNSLIWLLQHRSNLEMDCCAVERIQEYVGLPQERSGDLKLTQIDQNWPNAGNIKINDLSVTINKNEILKHITLKIKQGHKVGIVGRTGAGKSTFLNVFFQLYQYQGQILVDDVNLNEIDKQIVRKRLTLIPQDPILFKGTIRDNLDLFNEYEDQQLYRVMDKAHIKMKLDDLVEFDGNNKSIGEKQLLCLARAMLKNSKLICIDEGTANLDDASTEVIQKLMINMKETTILCVAHKIKTIIGFDKIIVMNHGEIVEYNTPQVLINNPNSYFLKLCKESGDYEFIISEFSRIMS